MNNEIILSNSDDGDSSNIADRELVVAQAHGTQLSTDVRQSTNQLDDDLIDTGRIWRVIVRYKKVIALSAISIACLAFIYSLLLRPVYIATVVIRYNNNVTLLDAATESRAAFRRNGDWNAYETTLNLLAGKAVGEQALSSLGLQTNPEFTGRLQQRRLSFNPVKLLSMFNSQTEDVPDQKNSLSVSEYAKGVFKNNVAIAGLKDTNLITASYSSFNPQTAALIANQLVDAFNQVEEIKQKAESNETLEILNNELKGIQGRLLLSERKLTEFARKTGVVDLEESGNLMNARQTSIQAKYIEVQDQRMALEIEIEKIKDEDDLEVLEGLVDNPSIVSLRSDLAALRSEHNNLSNIFQPSYPKLQSLTSQIASLRLDIRNEVDRGVKQLIAKYEGLYSREIQLESQMDVSKDERLDLKDRSVAFNLLKREWESNKKSYEGMLEKVKASSSAANLSRNRLLLSEPAVVPTSKSSPSITKNVSIGLSMGTLFGLALAFFLALRDRQFRSIQEVEDHASAPILAVVPLLVDDLNSDDDEKASIERSVIATMTHYEPSSQIAEIFRSLRTSLMYSVPGRKLNMLMITSSGPGEGKTTSTVNLAITFARNGKRTVIIDLDLRKPSLHKVFNLPRAPGLADGLVSGHITTTNTDIENLFIVPAGSESPNPTEMIESERCRTLISDLQKHFDVVLFDAPPVMGLADSLILSQYSKFLVMAVDIGKTNKDSLKSAMGRLRRVNAPIVGIIITRHDTALTDSYQYENYHYNYAYNYAYGEGLEQIEGPSAGDKRKLFGGRKNA